MEFEDIFGDLFKNLRISTQEEIAKEKEELKRQRKIILENQRQFSEYVRLLPGSERENKSNPIIGIRGEVVDDELKVRAITLEESLDELFKEAFVKEEEQIKKR